MADFGSPIAQDVQAPNALTTLSGLMSIKQKQQALTSGALGIQQQQQNLETGLSTQSSAQSAATVAAQGAKETQAGAQLLSDPVGNGLTDESGQPTKNAQAIIMHAMPTTGTEKYASLVKAAQGHVEYKNAVQNLSQNEQAYVASRLQGIIADPNHHISDVSNGINQLKEQFKGTPQEDDINKMTGVMQSAINDAGDVHGRTGVDQVIQGFSRGALGNLALTGAGGIAAPQSATLDTGGQVTPGTIAPALQGGAFTPGQAPINRTLGPQIISQPITGAPAIIGGGAGSNPQPIGGGPGKGPNPWQPYAGQGADVASNQAEVQNTRSAGDQAASAHNINQQILRLADNAKTGPGTDIWQHAVGALGAPLGLSPTANYQELGKFLEKNAINNMQSMGGPPSDARLSAAAAANGSTSFSPEALKAVTKFNDATTTGLQQYRQGVDHAVGMGQNVNYTNLPAFKSQWAKNFDVNIFRVDNAMRDGDKAELQKIAKELGPDGLRALAQKRQNLQQLSQTGQIGAPQ